MIRELVLATNAIWPFAYIYRLPYNLSIYLVKKFCKLSPQIKGAYLSSSLGRGDWVPGLSDIDIFIVTYSALDSNKEYIFLKSFQKKVSFLKMFFPMLNHVGILNETFFHTWTKLCYGWYDPKTWALIYGEDEASRRKSKDIKLSEIGYINHSLSLYLSVFLPKYFRKFPRGYLEFNILKRTEYKILQSLRFSEEEKSRNANVNGNDMSDILYNIVCQINKRTQEFCNKNEFVNAAKSNAYNSLEPIVTSNDRKKYVIFNDEITREEFKRYLDGINADYARSGIAPYLLTHSAFKYLLHYHSPWLYHDFNNPRNVIYRRDLIGGISAPENKYLEARLIQDFLWLLILPQSEKIINIRKDESLLSQVDEVIRTIYYFKIYFEKGTLIYDWEEVLDRAKEDYPYDFKIIEKFEKEICSIAKEEVGEKYFNLLRDLIGGLNETIDNRTNLQ